MKLTKKEFEKILKDKVVSECGVTLDVASAEQIYRCMAMIVRQIMSDRQKQFQAKTLGEGKKQVYYLCMEFLMGRSLRTSLFNLGLNEVAEQVLADADIVIRNYLKGAIPTEQVKQAYIPDMFGKERRKAAPGKEGKLGVEGMTPEVILAALRNAGATIEGEETTSTGGITKQDLMALGLSGGSNAGEKRKALLKKLNLPEHMSANAMLQALNLLYTREELEQMLNESGIERD